MRGLLGRRAAATPECHPATVVGPDPAAVAVRPSGAPVEAAVNHHAGPRHRPVVVRVPQPGAVGRPHPLRIVANVMNQMRHGYLAVRECPDPPSVRMRGIGVRVAEYDDVTNVGCRHPPCRAPHSFTAPIMIPLTKYRCTNGYTSAIGTTTNQSRILHHLDRNVEKLDQIQGNVSALVGHCDDLPEVEHERAFVPASGEDHGIEEAVPLTHRGEQTDGSHDRL